MVSIIIHIIIVNHLPPFIDAVVILIFLFPFCRLDGRHVVFGKVIEGLDVVYKVEAIGSPGGQTTKKVVIVKSGELPVGAEAAEDAAKEL